MRLVQLEFAEVSRAWVLPLAGGAMVPVVLDEAQRFWTLGDPFGTSTLAAVAFLLAILPIAVVATRPDASVNLLARRGSRRSGVRMALELTIAHAALVLLCFTPALVVSLLGFSRAGLAELASARGFILLCATALVTPWTGALLRLRAAAGPTTTLAASLSILAVALVAGLSFLEAVASIDRELLSSRAIVGVLCWALLGQITSTAALQPTAASAGVRP